MSVCLACYHLLPEPTHTGHRKRKYCNAACKQRYYRKHEGKRDAHSTKFWKEQTKFWKEQSDHWRTAYEQEREKHQGTYKYMDRVDEQMAELLKAYDDMRIDYTAKLKAVGMNEKEIAEFDAYWKQQAVNPFERLLNDFAVDDARSHIEITKAQ